MKVTRNIRAAINRRANEVAQQLTSKIVARLTELIEAEEIMPMYIEHWWPTSFDPVLCNWGVSGGRHEAPADVCGNCDCAMPDGCEGTFRDENACRWAKESADRPARDPGFDATDHLAGF